MNDRFKPRLTSEEEALFENNSSSAVQSVKRGDNHIDPSEIPSAENNDAEWMKNLASRRKQKKHEQEQYGQEQISVSLNRPEAQENADFFVENFEEELQKEKLSTQIETEKQISKKPTLFIGRGRKEDQNLKKEVKPYWLWLLLGSFLILVVVVVALRFLDKTQTEIAGFDKPFIALDNVEWKVRPDDPGGAEIPFENLEIMDTTGNARLLQNQVDLLLPSVDTNKQTLDEMKQEEPFQEQLSDLLDIATASEDALYDETSINHPVVEVRKQEGNIAKKVEVPSDIPLIDGGISAWQVQLATVFSEKDARAEWQRFARRYGNLILEQPVLISRSGDNYMLRIGHFDSSRKANELCERLKASGGDCLLFSPR